MAKIIDQYGIANYAVAYQMSNAGGMKMCGQSITGDGQKIVSINWAAKRTGDLSATLYVARVYTHSGTFGTSSVPTGTALATSDPINGNIFRTDSIQNSFVQVGFAFSGANSITLVNTTKYVVTIEYLSGTEPDGTHYLDWGSDNTTPTHNGNACYMLWGSAWAASGRDGIFVVKGDIEEPHGQFLLNFV